MDAGIHSSISMQDYLALPALSASVVQTLLNRCPRAAWFKSWLNPAPVQESTKAMNAGTIAHSILLEGSMAGVEVIDPALYPTKTTGNIPDGWTNKDIRAARDAAIAAGKIPVLAPDMESINALVAEARAFIESLKREPMTELAHAVYAAFQPSGGESELTMIWQDGPTLCRMRPDRISTDRKLIVDYKTGGVSAEPDQWGRTQMIRMGYYVSAAFYRRGIEALFNVSPEYVFLVQEQDSPFLCSLVGVDPHGFDLGTRQIEAGIARWADCVARDDWPAYPTRVCYPEIPAWEDARWEERDQREAYDQLQEREGLQP